MNVFLKKLHRWLGVPLGLLFSVTFATGFLSAVDELASRDRYSGYTYRDSSLDEDARALAMMTAKHEGIRQVVMPTERTPYYQAVLKGERFTYAIDDLRRPVHEMEEEGGFFETVLQLHRNYLLGKEGLLGIEGKYYAATVALLALFISLVGFWLWLPLRRTFRARKMLPASSRRRDLHQSHTTGGVVMLVFIAVLSLTGASITFRAAAQWIFGVEPAAAVHEPVSLARSWHAWLNAAQAAMPGGELVAVRFPRAPGNALEFRFLAPGDWLGLPASNVQVDPDNSTLIDVRAFRDLPPGEKLYSVLKPLHMGKGLPAIYVLVQLALSLLGLVVVLAGISSFTKKKRSLRGIWRDRSKRGTLGA